MRGRDEGAFGFAVHCARYTDGQAVGTIPMAPAAEVTLGERSPDASENFLKGFSRWFRRDQDVVVAIGADGCGFR
jgi:hypothetical protein